MIVALVFKSLELQSNMQNAYKRAQTKNVELQSEKLENYMKQMRLIYCMTKNDIAASNFQDLMHVQVLNSVTCDYSKKLEILTEFEQCFESVIEKDLLSQMKESLFLGIM